MSFTVEPEALRRVGNDMRTLAQSIERAGTFANTYLRVEGTNGTRLAAIGQQINEYRDPLVKDYSPRGDAWKAYDGFGGAMHSMARDYQTTDRAQAERYDRLMDEVHIDPVEAPPTLQAPTVTLAEFTREFVKPPEGFPGFDAYNEFTDKVDKLLGLDALAKVLTVAGARDVIELYKKELEGDWKQVGRAVGAMRALSRYWLDMEGATRAMPNNFDGAWIGNRFRNQVEGGVSASWTGHAAAAATRHLYRLAGTASEHYNALENKANAITLQMFTANDLLDQAIGLIEDLVALMPAGSTAGQQIKDFFDVEKLGVRLAKMIGIAAKLLVKLRLIVDACALIVSLLSELSSSLSGLDFPQVTYAVPDVNGPAA